MDAKNSSIHGRLGGGPTPRNVVCQFWMMGKCNRNPCRFIHGEVPPPSVYSRTYVQSNVLLEKHSRKSSSLVLNNSMALVDGSQSKTAHKSVNHVIRDPPRKRPASEDKWTRESSNSGTDPMVVEEMTAPRKFSDSSVQTEACKDKTVKKSSSKAWICGDWFSILANLKGHTEAISGIILPSRSGKLYSSSSDGTVRMWDCYTGQSTRVINLGDKIGALICEGPWIFVGMPNVIKAWNTEIAADLNLNGPVGQVYALAVSVAFDLLFAGAQDGSILAWKGNAQNANPFELAACLKGHFSAVICLTVGEKMLYSGSMDNTIRAWNLNTLQCIHTLNGHNDSVTSLICWGQYLLSCSLDQTIKVWDATEEGNLELKYAHKEEYGAIALAGMSDAEGKPIIFCSCNDNSVYLYELPSFNKRGMIFSEREVRTIKTGPDGIFFTGDGTGMLDVWKVRQVA